MVVSGAARIGGLEARLGTTVVLPAAVASSTPVAAEVGAVILEIGLV